MDSSVLGVRYAYTEDAYKGRIEGARAGLISLEGAVNNLQRKPTQNG